MLIFDSIHKTAGHQRIPKIRKLLLRPKVITKRDKCEAMHTQPQSESECGSRMAMYMLAFGKILKGLDVKTRDIKHEIENHLDRERRMGTIDENLLARTTMQEVLYNKQLASQSL